MKGHVPTPDTLATHIVEKLFETPPDSTDRILYPGCGKGPFIQAVHDYCNTHDVPTPDGVAIELDPEHLEDARERHADKNVELLERDFLKDIDDFDEFDYIVGNPPYVPIEALHEDEKQRYRSKFDTAEGRFDLYILFLEQALGVLKDGGWLSFVTPEKYEYVGTAEPLRRLLTTYHVEEIEHVEEDAFGGLITFPAVTTVSNTISGTTHIKRRDGTTGDVKLPTDGSSWASTVREGDVSMDSGVTLGEVCERISCGVATGADKVFVEDDDEVAPQLREWTYPTTSGKQLRINNGPDSGQVLISPYDEDGNLPLEDELGAYGDWAELYRDRLEDRSCYEKGRRAWYAWHENPPMTDILQPKLVCKDITEAPHFWRDDSGEVLPRHSVYYLIPKEDVGIEELQEYLNSAVTEAWLEANCQRAANGFLRMQSTVLKGLPVPQEFGESHQAKLTQL
ncbi:TaqI-like C-terminal specificity domain-containing protein [Halobacterium salinarum]|uniref:Eco57I restriction-modification methylase domain-containing protein n=1 Tax=Halobacterium salinarum TaxID=2242 RepID=UPI0025557088|nr:TaqI-like C-terminal specificity domain-containing protein [Halobacterium salinarum]MDL0120609.1 TaqI-like C-terminal specificity domain-containing protein [Halobacterium salinarum]